MERNTHGIVGGIARNPLGFAAAFVAMFVFSFVFLAAADVLPEPVTTAHTNAPSVQQTQVTPAEAEQPVRIVAQAVELDVKISNPTSTNVNVLDAALLSGAVRYPTTALLGQEGTMLVFGHSSHLPVVHNQAYKAFNNIEKLEQGDTVSVFSATAEYRYKVVGVRVADATEDVIELAERGKHLVLVTCDSFTAKTSRFVVTAEFVGTYSLTSN